MHLKMIVVRNNQKAIEKYRDRNVLVFSVEHDLWWKGNCNGYTPNKKDAGVYTFNEALEKTKHCTNDIEFHFLDKLGENHIIKDIQEGETDDLYSNPNIKFDKYIGLK